jgi:hypothetical protein
MTPGPFGDVRPPTAIASWCKEFKCGMLVRAAATAESGELECARLNNLEVAWAISGTQLRTG